MKKKIKKKKVLPIGISNTCMQQKKHKQEKL